MDNIDNQILLFVASLRARVASEFERELDFIF